MVLSAAALAGALAASGCGGQAVPTASDLPPTGTDVPPAGTYTHTMSAVEAWARPALSGTSSAVYMTLENEADEADTLVGAWTDAARTVTAHETVHDGDVVRMRPLQDGIAVPAHGRATLEPGGMHLMLKDLQRDLATGDTLGLVLRFENYGNLAVDVPVRRGP